MSARIWFGGGLNEQQNPDLNEAYIGSYNFELSKDSNALIPRKPYDLKGTATNAGDIRGIMQLITRSGAVTSLVQAGNVLYSWDGATAFTSKGSPDGDSQLRDCYWSLDDILVITDLQKLTPVSKWDGTTFSTLTTGLGITLYAKYAIVHNSRVWLFNVTAGTDTPHLIVASAFENPFSYDNTKQGSIATFTTGLEAFYLTTPDLRAINGVAKTVAGDLILSTVEGSLFKLTGSSASDYAFVEFYPGSNAVGTESMTSIGNDIVYMKRDGNIDLVSATQAYGDITANDLSRWIATTVAGLSDSITVYDQTRQKVLFFVPGKVLVLFKDILYGGAPIGDKGQQRANLSPWSVYRTNDGASFTTSAAKYMRIPGTTQYTVYFGDSAGRMFDLYGEGVDGDAGEFDITVVRRTRHITESDGYKAISSILKGVVQYRRLNELPFTVTALWSDEFNESDSTFTLKGATNENAGYYGGLFYYLGPTYYGPSYFGTDYISHINFSIVGKGPGCLLTFSTSDTLTYQVDHCDII